ncbi:hypothetical protein NBC97_23335, partial [Salmonella sp. NW1027]
MQILKAIGLLMEYPDDELWECRDEALALIQHDAPMLANFTRELLYAPLLDKQAEWCEVLMNPLMILVKIIKLRWIHILSYDQM